MTLSDLIGLQASFLVADLDNYAASGSLTPPPSGSVVPQINYAVRAIGRMIRQFKPLVSFTVVPNVQSYNYQGSAFQLRMTEVISVTIAGSALKNWARQPGLFSFPEIQKKYPSWATTVSGTPVAAFQLSNELWLYPRPSSAFQAYVAGFYIPPDLVNAADVPDLPVELHESVAFLASVYAATPYVTEEEGLARIQAYNAAWAQFIRDTRERNDRMFGQSSYARGVQ
ncbi:MAG: hypothetical protein JSS66_00165 [Armatimonadetes bacterium]|nr:hypothetical protein [Armatimonadota bacterium]